MITVHVLVAVMLLATGELKVETSHHWSNDDCMAAARELDLRMNQQGPRVVDGNWTCTVWTFGPSPARPLVPKRNS